MGVNWVTVGVYWIAMDVKWVAMGVNWVTMGVKWVASGVKRVSKQLWPHRDNVCFEHGLELGTESKYICQHFR